MNTQLPNKEKSPAGHDVELLEDSNLYTYLCEHEPAGLVMCNNKEKVALEKWLGV